MNNERPTRPAPKPYARQAKRIFSDARQTLRIPEESYTALQDERRFIVDSLYNQL